MDRAISELIQNDQNDKQTGTDQADKNKTPTADADRDDIIDDRPKSAGKDSISTTRGRLKTKIFVLKKKVETRKRTLKCSECNVMKQTIKELNSHHEKCHNPQICGVCGKLFKLASSLTCHIYEHNKPRFSCDQCDFMCQF